MVHLILTRKSSEGPSSSCKLFRDRERRLQPLPEPVTEGAYAFHRREIACELAGFAKSDSQ
jgi:hypothetical protein